MRVLERFRSIIYWTIDFLKGAPIRHQLDDVSELLSSDDSAIRLGLSKTNDYLKSILNYASNKVPFYSKFQSWQRLEDFPVINKAIIRENESLFLSPDFKDSALEVRLTSGSTGTPFKVFQDRIKRNRATADTIFFSNLAGYNLGMRLYYSRVWIRSNTRSKLQCIRQNWILHDTSKLSGDRIMDFIKTLERDRSTKSVIIFASSLSEIAKYLERNDIKISAKVCSFITISESLDDWTKEVIERRFMCPVISRYSDEELGILAQQKPGSNEFLANTASFHFEVLDMKQDIPAKEGEMGRIVVTDLFNHAMPLIRYDTGDLALIKTVGENKQIIFESIGGRRVDCVYNTKGEVVSPYIIINPMHEFLEIRQFQFIQDGEKDYRLLLNPETGDTPITREGELISTLKVYLGFDANISVFYVDEIPVLRSGKRKQVINNYKPA